MQYVFKVEVKAVAGYAGYMLTAPSMASVVAAIAEEDKEDLTRPEVISLMVTRVQL